MWNLRGRNREWISLGSKPEKIAEDLSIDDKRKMAAWMGCYNFPIMTSPTKPVVMRMLENSNGEFLYAIVERMTDPDVDGELMRFRVHYHPPGSPRTATMSDTVVLDETGNQYDLRISFVKFLLDKRDSGWKQTGSSTFGSSPTEKFWSLEDL